MAPRGTTSNRTPILPDPKTGKFTMGAGTTGTAPILSATPTTPNRGYPSLTQVLAPTTPVGALPTTALTSTNKPAAWNQPLPAIDFKKIEPLPQVSAAQMQPAIPLPSTFEPTPAPNPFANVPPQTNPTSPQASALEQYLMNLLNQPAANLPPVGQFNVPDLPRTDISGLYGQFSPSINQAYDQLVHQLTGARSEQARGFADLIGRVQGSYAPTRQDVTGATSQAANAVQDLANRFGLGSTTQGQMGQRWAETSGRLEGLAGQNQAAQLGSLETLRNARDSMYNTFLSQAQGGRATGLADLANAIASGQSGIDVARSNNQSALAQAAMSGQLDLAKLAQSSQDSAFDRQMKILGLLTDLQSANAANQPVVTETTTQTNPGILNDLSGISDADVRNMVSQAWYSTEDPNAAIRDLTEQLYYTAPPIYNEETGQVRGMGSRTNEYTAADKAARDAVIQQAIDYLRPYATDYGGTSRKIETKRSNEKK